MVGCLVYMFLKVFFKRNWLLSLINRWNPCFLPLRGHHREARHFFPSMSDHSVCRQPCKGPAAQDSAWGRKVAKLKEEKANVVSFIGSCSVWALNIFLSTLEEQGRGFLCPLYDSCMQRCFHLWANLLNSYQTFILDQDSSLCFIR